MYFITNPTTIMREKYYKEDKKHLLVPTKVPHLFKSYDQARNAIERTATFCRKLRKLNLYGGLDQHNNVAVQPLPYITKHYRGQFKRDAVYRYRMHQIALKGGFYGFSPKGLSIVRVVMPKIVPSGRVMETEVEAIARGEYALMLSMLNGWVDNDLDREVIRHFSKKRTLSAVDKTVIKRLYDKYTPFHHSVIGDFDLSGKNVVFTDDSDAFSSGPANYTTPIVPDPIANERWYDRWAREWRAAWENYKRMR